MIELLLGQDIDVNRQNNYGVTAFYHAVDRGHYKVIKLLLDRDDIDHNIPDNHGCTPLFIAVSGSNRSVQVVDLLLRKKGIDVNARDEKGSTALALVCTTKARSEDTVDFVRLLLSHPDTDPNILDNNGVSVLSKVVELGGIRTDYWGFPVTDLDKYQRIESLLRAAGAR